MKDSFTKYTKHACTVQYKQTSAHKTCSQNKIICIQKSKHFAYFLYCTEAKECSNLYFVFRWLLIWFKREFSMENILRLWEVRTRLKVIIVGLEKLLYWISYPTQNLCLKVGCFVCLFVWICFVLGFFFFLHNMEYVRRSHNLKSLPNLFQLVVSIWKERKQKKK